MDFSFYRGKKIFITGHTGFKGSWLAFWLTRMGANVAGYALPPQTTPNHFDLLGLDMESHLENINDLEKLQKAVITAKPDIVFHLAAQPLVRYSYLHPIETYQTNIMGTANVLEASRYCPSVKAIIVVTTDKCYENLEQQKGYVETDRMGGYDPYSSSKGCAELVVSSYRNSFFNLNDYNQKHNVLLASARAGNVIGGGDWSEDRLIPDIIKSAIKGKPTSIRFPNATRPWQHVLEPLKGYLMLGEKLFNGNVDFADAWNFGPNENEVLSVGDVLKMANENWSDIQYTVDTLTDHAHEAGLLSLNIDKAKTKLGWMPKWSNEESIGKAIAWYKAFYKDGTLLTQEQIKLYSL
jgi:CDP-glucose 4,6-dehydratase